MAHIRLTGKGKHVFLLILPQYLKQCFIIHYKIHVQSKILEKLYLGFYVATGDIGEPSNTSKSMNCDMFVLPFYYGIGLPALGSVSSFLCSPSPSRKYLCASSANFSHCLSHSICSAALCYPYKLKVSLFIPYSQWELCYFTKRHCDPRRPGLPLQ